MTSKLSNLKNAQISSNDSVYLMCDQKKGRMRNNGSEVG